MKGIILFFLALGFAFFPSCCDRDGRDDFSFERRDYDGNNLRLDGYYFSKDKDVLSRYYVFFLFQNGIFYDGVYRRASSLFDLDSVIQSSYKQVTEVPYWWGIYYVESESIFIERWQSTSGCESYPVYGIAGEIINDSTIYFSESNYDTMRFRQFSPKPDSSTNYIEGS